MNYAIRPLHFRCWDTKYKRWVGLETFFGAGYGGLHEVHEDVLVTQDTGLIDKNGKPIFEGDILQIRAPYRTSQTHYGENIPFPDGQYTEYLEPEIKQIIDIVVFNDGMFALKNKGSFDRDSDSVYPLIWEISTYTSEEIQNRIGTAHSIKYDDPEEGDLKYLLEAYKLNSEDELIKYLGVEVIGNIFENKELIKE